MMWIGFLLVLFFGSDFYWDEVQALRDRGCHVYNLYYVSCADVQRIPPGAVPIPDDAVEVIP